MSEEMQDYLANKSLILDFHRESYVKAFIVDSDVDATIRKGTFHILCRKSVW